MTAGRQAAARCAALGAGELSRCGAPAAVRVAIRRKLVTGTREFTLDVAFQSAHRRLALFGPSGSGKTLTVQAIAGLMRPDAGRIVLNGRTLFDAASGVCLPSRARRVAYLFQDYALFPHLTVAQNVCFGLTRSWRNPRRRRLPAIARHWIDTFELGAIANNYPHEISGGQKQRAALARALVIEPDILLLDEPLAALDVALRRRLRIELANLQRRLEIPMILITHDPEDVRSLAEAVYLIRDGRIVGSAAAHDI